VGSPSLTQFAKRAAPPRPAAADFLRPDPRAPLSDMSITKSLSVVVLCTELGSSG